MSTLRNSQAIGLLCVLALSISAGGCSLQDFDQYYENTDDAGAGADGGVGDQDVGDMGPDDDIMAANKVFVQHRFGAIPVIDADRKLVGILSSYDLLRAFGQILSEQG